MDSRGSAARLRAGGAAEPNRKPCCGPEKEAGSTESLCAPAGCPVLSPDLTRLVRSSGQPPSCAGSRGGGDHCSPAQEPFHAEPRRSDAARLTAQNEYGPQGGATLAAAGPSPGAVSAASGSRWEALAAGARAGVVAGELRSAPEPHGAHRPVLGLQVGSSADRTRAVPLLEATQEGEGAAPRVPATTPPEARLRMLPLLACDSPGRWEATGGEGGSVPARRNSACGEAPTLAVRLSAPSATPRPGPTRPTIVAIVRSLLHAAGACKGGAAAGRDGAGRRRHLPTPRVLGARSGPVHPHIYILPGGKICSRIFS